MIKRVDLGISTLLDFLMMLANHVNDKLIIAIPNAKLHSWVQEKRVFKDLLRMNLHSSVDLKCFPIMEPGNEGKIFGFPSTFTSQPPIFLPFATMDTGNDPQHPSQVAQPSKSKSNKPSSGVSQKAPIVKSKKIKNVGSVKVADKGYGRVENQ